jgi:hypothetical protein
VKAWGLIGLFCFPVVFRLVSYMHGKAAVLFFLVRDCTEFGGWLDFETALFSMALAFIAMKWIETVFSYDVLESFLLSPLI